MNSLLAIFLHLPNVRSKNSQMLTLRALQQRGWNVTVLTLDHSLTDGCLQSEDWDGVTILKLPPRSERYRRILQSHAFKGRCLQWQQRGGLARVSGRMGEKLARLFSRVCSAGDSYAAERQYILDDVAAVIKQQSPSVLLSLYHPLTSHRVARDLAGRFSLPWLAINKDFYSWPNEFRAGISGISNRLKRSREARALHTAHTVAVVNGQMVDYFRELLPGKTVEELGHCFEESGSPAPEVLPSGPFRLVTVGQTGRYDVADLRNLFQIVGRLHREGLLNPQEFRLRFVGHGGELVRRAAQGTNCEDLLEILPQQHHLEAFREMQQATCLYFQQVGWGSRRRLAEYIGAERPILVYPSYAETTADQALRAHGAARIAHSPQELERHLRELVSEYRLTGALQSTANPELVASFSATSRAAQLDRMLQKLCQNVSRTSPESTSPDSLVETSGRTFAGARSP